METGVGGGAEDVDDIEVGKEDDRRAVYPNEGPGRVQPGSPLSATTMLSIGLTTVPYTPTAVQNTALYGYAPYRNKAVLTKSWLATVWLCYLWYQPPRTQ